MNEKEIGVEQARAILGKLVDDAAIDGQVTYLTRRGRQHAAIVPISLVPQESTVRTITLVSANPGDVIDGIEISDPESPIEWADLPQAAKDWATGQGYGPDSEDELLYVVTEGAEVPTGFPVFVVEQGGKVEQTSPAESAYGTLHAGGVRRTAVRLEDTGTDTARLQIRKGGSHPEADLRLAVAVLTSHSWTVAEDGGDYLVTRPPLADWERDLMAAPAQPTL